MLEPGKRTLYIDALRPPSDYQLSWGIGTTYSLELETLLSVPLAFSLYECKNQKEILNNSIFALDAIRRNASKLVIFCQHGEIKISSTDSLLYSYLEDMIVEVNPSSGGVFHPKIWLLRFKNQEEEIFYKYICLSRNITFDRSWDTILVLDGKPVEYEVPENDQLIKFVNFLPKIAVNKIEKNRLDIIKKISNELGKIKFNPPENFDNQFNFHFLGIDHSDSFPISDKYRRLLIVSPFLSESFLNRFEKVKQKYLISLQSSLDKISDDTLKKYNKIWVLDELAEDESEDDISRLSGLHAKLYIGENKKSVTLWNGSSNATQAGFSSQNVEALVELRGERRKVGIGKFIDEKSEQSIVTLLKEYGKTTLTEEEEKKENLEKELEKKLEEYKANLLKIGLGVKIRPESKELYKIIIYPHITNSKYSSEEIKGICYPITLQKQTDKIDLPLLWKNNIIFYKVPLLSLTSLVAFELNIKENGISQKMEFVLNLSVEGMPERRNDKIIRAILRDSNGFIQYLRILLTENQNILPFNPNIINNGKGNYKNRQNQIPLPLAEELIKALSRDPDKIKNIHDLIKELSKNKEIKDDIIPVEFKEMWEHIWRVYKNQYGKRKKASFPDIPKILSQLKDFQRKTVKYAFKQMYERENPTRRFLIADEVGLGKTLVARGLIAKAIDRFKSQIQNGTKRYDIIYICSNAEIAKQNINRLNVIGGVDRKEFTFTSRITLLPVELKNIKNNRINFISFTPGTSFNLRSSEGTYQERALIYHLLKEEWRLSYRPKYVKFFQCQAKLEYWGEYLTKNFNQRNSIDTFLANKFLENLRAKIVQENKNSEENIYDRFKKIAEEFNYLPQSKKVPYNISRERNRIIGELRLLLAKSCISSLEPDFIILDEFQRFKNLLDGQDEMCKLAREMFDFEDTKLLLLSATPYKMYTLYQEDEIHYDDFIRTAQFLLTNKDDLKNSNRDIMLLKTQLEQYKNLLYRLNENNLSDLYKYKRKIEKILGKVMCRTERDSGVSKQDSMIKEYTEKVEIEHQEIIDFINIDKIAQVVKHRSCMEYWKSSPYLLNFMDDDYKLKKDCRKEIEDGSSRMEDALLSAKNNFLPWRKISHYREISANNHKLRVLLKNTMKDKAWKLLWIPPSLPYYRSKPFFDDLEDYTKSLVFSSWKVVPKTIASLCSYEAERNAKDFNQEEYGYEGTERRKIKELNFAIKEDKPASMNLMTLFFPCMTLAQKINPLKITQNYMKENGSLPSAVEIENEIKHKIRNILETTVLREKLDSEGTTDQRWYWVSLIFMDRIFYKDKIQEWFSLHEGDKYNFKNISKKSDKDTEDDLKQDKKSEPNHFADHISYLEKFFELEPLQMVKELGNPPKDLLSILSKIVLASPAVASLRALSEYSDKYNPALFYNAALISFSFRSLYILPETISLIKRLFPKGPYWKKILNYNIAGNLQSLLDEYMYILFESLGLMNLSEKEKIIGELGEHIEKVISIRTPSLYFDEIKIKDNKVGEIKKRSIRCRFAMRFGTGIVELGQEVSNLSEVRNAFNSPFRPFILATTSIGQEGLDFHQYCHSIYHWNLPPNPVDLEQREGRVFRYKGHAIRKNIATKYGIKLLGSSFSGNLWENLFKIALKEREIGANDLIPFWIFNQGKAKIQRHIPAMPMSREKNQKDALSRSVAVYRMVFGQPRQEDLINFINSQAEAGIENLKIDEIINYRIDLTPR